MPMSATALGDVTSFHRKFVTGVPVVTTMADDKPYGLVVNAFSSVTISPATILVCINQSSSTHDVLYGAERFAVNLLSHDQVDVARRFATKGGDKFAGLRWHVGDHGQPALDGTCAVLEAEISSRVSTSTHTVFFADVLAASSTDRAPLVYAAGGFFDGSRLEPVQASSAS
jgi:flavin reductase (DIM6/NTAB) family NADH-FMN oxidoreductase RutF